MSTVKDNRRAESAESLHCALAWSRFDRLERRPLFQSAWMEALFIHYEVAPQALQREVPFELDLFDGQAYVSLVAFTMRDLRFAFPAPFGKIGRLLTAPIATHELLNVRTYVKHENEPGIYFMAEWIPNALSVIAGPRTYGLPYRLAKMKYEHSARRASGEVMPCRTNGALKYEAHIDPESFDTAAADSLREFLLERYTAYTMQPPGNRGGVARRFRIWHRPWRLARADVTLIDESALVSTGNWHRYANLIGADYSPGIENVLMGRPRRC